MYQVKDMDTKKVLFETEHIYIASAKKREFIIKGVKAYIHRK